MRINKNKYYNNNIAPKPRNKSPDGPSYAQYDG